MNRGILIIVLFFFFSHAQSQYFTRDEGEVLVSQLKAAQSDSTKIDLLLKVAEYHIISSYDHPSNFDTATLLINQAKDLNAKARIKSVDLHILLINSYFFRMSGQREKGKAVIIDAINQLKYGPYYEMLGKAYYELSNYYDYDFKYNTIYQRAKYIEMAVSAFEKAGAINDLGNCYKVLADLHHLVNEYPRALREIEIALQYYKVSQYKRLEGVYDLFGQLYYARGDYKQALAYELLALKTANNNKDAGLQLCQIENNVGLTFFKLNDGDAALRHFTNALEIAEREREIETVFGMTSHIVETYISLGKPEEGLKFLRAIEEKHRIPETDKFETVGYMFKAYLNLYTALKQYSAARYYCNQLILKSNAPGLDIFKLNGYYTEIIKYYTAIRDYENAQKYLQKNRQLVDSIRDDLGAARNYTMWFALDTSQGNFKSAVNNMLKANFIKDTILNTAKSSEIKQLEVQYESEKKENDIKLKDQQIKFLTQEDQLRQAKLDRAKLIRNATLIAVMLLLLLGGILLNQYKQKRRSNILITQRNEQLNQLVKEKEWLVKEVHHRVKNNLQMVISLLNSQSAYLDNDAAILAIQDSQRRMQTMSLIHQKLYQSENVSVIDMRAYINELVNYLKEIYDTRTSIRFEQDIDAVELDVSHAIPVGLILNELITNSIKYAFAGRDNEVIRISMHYSDNDHIMLSISDNGKGLPKDFDSSQTKSLGMSLVTGLAKQLEGQLEMVNKEGLKIIIKFPYDRNSNSVQAENGIALNTIV